VKRSPVLAQDLAHVDQDSSKMMMDVKYVITLAKDLHVLDLDGMIVSTVSQEVYISLVKDAKHAKTDISTTNLSNYVSEKTLVLVISLLMKVEIVSHASTIVMDVQDQLQQTALIVEKTQISFAYLRIQK
jgi:hypothetical protein